MRFAAFFRDRFSLRLRVLIAEHNFRARCHEHTNRGGSDAA
jgi:hypothetical protein